MVSGIGSVTDYSAIGSLNLLQGTDQTNSADDTFMDILSDAEGDDNSDTETSEISDKASEKSDLYEYIKDAMGMPAGVNVEGFEYTQSSDSAAQATSESTETSGSESGESQQYDEMDLNKDGVVTADEIMQYMQNQQKNQLSETLENSLNKYSSNNIMGGLNTLNAASAYNNTLTSISGSAMTLNIAV